MDKAFELLFCICLVLIFSVFIYKLHEKKIDRIRYNEFICRTIADQYLDLLPDRQDYDFILENCLINPAPEI